MVSVSLLPGFPSDSFSWGQVFYWKWRPGGLCQEWPFSRYHLHWVEQGRQMRIPATSAGSSTPYTVLSGATALLILLQSAAFHTASQLRRCQAGPGMGYMPSTMGASSCLELPFPYCRNPSPTALRRGTSSALLPLLSQTTAGASSVLPPVCTGPWSRYCCSVRLLWQGREKQIAAGPQTRDNSRPHLVPSNPGLW